MRPIREGRHCSISGFLPPCVYGSLSSLFRRTTKPGEIDRVSVAAAVTAKSLLGNLLVLLCARLTIRRPVLVLFAPAASSSCGRGWTGSIRATDISRSSISHGLHNACSRRMTPTTTTTVVAVARSKVPFALISVSLPLPPPPSGRVRLVNRNPGSRLTANSQPREESRDTFVCRCRLFPRPIGQSRLSGGFDIEAFYAMDCAL